MPQDNIVCAFDLVSKTHSYSVEMNSLGEDRPQENVEADCARCVEMFVCPACEVPCVLLAYQRLRTPPFGRYTLRKCANNVDVEDMASTEFGAMGLYELTEAQAGTMSLNEAPKWPPKEAPDGEKSWVPLSPRCVRVLRWRQTRSSRCVGQRRDPRRVRRSQAVAVVHEPDEPDEPRLLRCVILKQPSEGLLTLRTQRNRPFRHVPLGGRQHSSVLRR